MKKFLYLLFIAFLQFHLNAQNVTMAKAFYKKAQQEYENKNYQEVINLLEKTVENLNGETNPDIIYLEAKSRYENDLNINKAKSLFQQFLEEADGNDGRISEVSSTLVEIESSDKYYENGHIKNKLVDCNKGYFCYKSFLADGSLQRLMTIEKTENYQSRYANLNLEQISSLFVSFLQNDLDIKEEIYCNNNIVMHNEKRDGSIYQIIFIDGNQYIKREFDKNEITQKNFTDGQICGQPIFYLIQLNLYAKKINYYDLNSENLLFHIDNKNKDFYYFTEFNSWTNDDYISLIRSIDYNKYASNNNKFIRYDYGTAPEPFDKIVEGYPIKASIKIPRKNVWNTNDYVFHFDSNGLPTKQEYYSRGNLKDTKYYNKENQGWDRK